MVNSTINLKGKDFKDYEELVNKLANIINVKKAGTFFMNYKCDCDSEYYRKGDQPFSGYTEDRMASRLKEQMGEIIKEFIYED